MSDREAIRHALMKLRNRLEALQDDIAAEPFASSYSGTLRTQEQLCRWNKKHLIPAMIDLIVEIESAGCDTAPDYIETASELRDAIGDKLTDLFHAPHEVVRERAAEETRRAA